MLKQVPICDCKAPFEIPLMWTFVFKGFEFWCPYCGKSHKDAPKKVKNTDELQKRLELYKKHSENYLDAKSTQMCAGMRLYGKWVSQEKLPEDFKEKARKVIADYEFKVVLE